MVEVLNNKQSFYDVAKKNNIPTPRTFSPTAIENIDSIGDIIEYPCVIKPAYGYLYKYLHFKALLAKSRFELIENYKKLANYSNDLVIQEIIPGNDDLQFSLATYFNRNSLPLATFTSRKIRQLPPRFGTGTFVGSCLEPTIVKLGTSFLRKLNYRGIAEIEFKKDPRDGRFKMIEVNTRIWTQNNLAERSGIDLPYIAYVDILGGKAERRSQTKQSIKWVNLCDDFLACFGSLGYFNRGEITPSIWLKSLISKKEHAVFAVDDMRPFMKASQVFLSRLKKGMINRIKTHSSSIDGLFFS